jgi:hypothetical protein
MGMKKGIFIALLFAFLVSIDFVSAAFLPSVRFISQDLVYTVTDFFQPILYALFGGFATAYIFETLLLFIIILCLVYLALGKVELIASQKSIRWTITIVVALLSVRFWDYEWLITVFNTYKMLGIVLTSILPFIIYFYFLYNVAGDHGIIRKMGWLLWIVVYIGLWSSSYVTDDTSMIYFWTFIVGAVCLIGDTTINRRLRLMHIVKNDENFKEREVSRLRHEIHQINQQIAAGTIDPKFARSQIKELESHIKEIRKM